MAKLSLQSRNRSEFIALPVEKKLDCKKPDAAFLFLLYTALLNPALNLRARVVENEN